MTYTAFASEVDPPAIALVKPPSIWKDETICAYVRKLWADHSASEICVALGKELGIAVGRNAIVGWLHRQKLTAEHKTKFHPLTKCTIAPRARSRPRREPKPETVRRRQGFGQPFVMRCAEVVELHISLEELTHDNCHWPSGSAAPYTFCGNAALKGGSYCPSHFALSIRPGLRQ